MSGFLITAGLFFAVMAPVVSLILADTQRPGARKDTEVMELAEH